MKTEPKLLDHTSKQAVQYCIPEFLKLEQIKINLRKPCGRIQAATELRNEPMACVSFGPSLKNTWEKIKEFKWVMSCSGSHKFLVGHGIIPTHHIDVDPREHKIKLIGEPQKGCEYLIASTCHPKLVDYLLDAGCTVKLWHIFDSAEEGYRILPPGEWLVTGGCSVGTRTITLARFLGFTDIHVFGMDGSFENEGGSHAAEHPNDASKKPPYETEYNGVKYRTTPSMLEAARNTWHELDMMADVNCTFHGEGLVQAMAKDYVRKVLPEKAQVFIAFDKPELISAEYKELNYRLHQENPMYGIGGAKHAKTVMNLCKALETTSVLDYGCISGRSRVHTPHGLVPIQELVNSNYRGPVLSISNDGRFEYRQVVGTQAASITESGKKWVIIKLRKGKPRPILTADHPCGAIRDVLNPVIEYVAASEMAGLYAVRLPRAGPTQFNRESPLFNEQQLSVLIGIGFGDGYYDKLGRMYNSHGLAQSDYVEFKKGILGGKTVVVPPSGFSPNNTILFHCQTNAQTKALRQLFYPESKKTVAKAVEYLDPVALAFWYMDDGRLKMIFNKPYANFHTEGFTDADQEIMVEALQRIFGLQASIYRGTHGKILHLNQASSNKLFELIYPYVCQSMEYKLPQEKRGGPKHKFNTEFLDYSAELVRGVVPMPWPKFSSRLYDLTVEVNHNFVTEHTLVHNCGKGQLAREIPFPIWEYDPAIPGKDTSPRPADIVACTDVLEHIEPEKLGWVLKDISRCTQKLAFFVIHTGPSSKTLADGRNSHILQRPAQWWRKILKKYFTVVKDSIKEVGPLLYVVVARKEKATHGTSPNINDATVGNGLSDLDYQI